MHIPCVLTIAGSDPSGGAGIQADLKTFSALGAYGASVITALTAQNTCGVRSVQTVECKFIAAQLDAVLDDLDIRAAKIGMVADPKVVEMLADRLTQRRPRWIVLDPVLVAKSGDALVNDEAIQAVAEYLVPLADIITPNLHEAAVLLGERRLIGRADMPEVARELRARGAKAVLIKGGALEGQACDDLLVSDAGEQWLCAPRIETDNLHGTGCSMSSAITARLAQGLPLPQAVEEAREWLLEALRASDQLNVGKGRGPVHHFHALW